MDVGVLSKKVRLTEKYLNINLYLVRLTDHKVIIFVEVEV